MTSFNKLRNAQRRILKNKNTDSDIRESMFSELIGPCRPCKAKGKRVKAVARIKEWALCEEHKQEAEKLIEDMKKLQASKDKTGAVDNSIDATV